MAATLPQHQAYFGLRVDWSLWLWFEMVLVLVGCVGTWLAALCCCLSDNL